MYDNLFDDDYNVLLSVQISFVARLYESTCRAIALVTASVLTLESALALALQTVNGFG